VYRGKDVAVKMFKSTSGARSSKLFVGSSGGSSRRSSGVPPALSSSRLYGVFVDSHSRVGLVTRYMEGERS